MLNLVVRCYFSEYEPVKQWKVECHECRDSQGTRVQLLGTAKPSSAVCKRWLWNINQKWQLVSWLIWKRCITCANYATSMTPFPTNPTSHRALPGMNETLTSLNFSSHGQGCFQGQESTKLSELFLFHEKRDYGKVPKEVVLSWKRVGCELGIEAFTIVLTIGTLAANAPCPSMQQN